MPQHGTERGRLEEPREQSATRTSKHKETTVEEKESAPGASGQIGQWMPQTLGVHTPITTGRLS